MAEMMMNRIVLLGAVLSALATSIANAQTQAPPAAVAAEASGRWDEAVAGYEAALAENPRQAELWIRIANIEAARQDVPASIAALQRAAKVLPADPTIFSKLSQAHAIAGQPAEALAAIEVAVSRVPESEEYLRARATLATWASDYSRARDSYRRIAKLNRNDIDLLADYARVSAWDGATDEAASLYRRYLKSRPEAAEVWLELARTESWRGNYAGATGVLEEHRRRFGPSAQNAQQLGAVMASGGRPRGAEVVISPLLKQTPEDYQLNLTRTIALAMQQRAGEASASLDNVRRLQPDTRDTRNAERMLRSILSSTADSRFGFYSDSDRLRVRRFEPRAAIAIRTGTRISAGYEQTRLEARSGSGLDQLNGSVSAEYRHGWASASQKIGPLTVGGQLGYAKAEGRELNTYSLRTELYPRDGVRIAAERSSGFFVISPRTVGLALTETAHRVEFDLMPTLRDRIAVEAAYRDLSDGNRRWELTISPRRSIARTSRVNLDLGASAYLLGTAYDLDNGYYDPRRYENYAVVVYPYFKIHEEIGLGLTLAAGAQRDHIAPDFHFGGTVSSEATFGIYRAWVLRVAGSATLNRRLDSGAYRGIGGTVALVRRF
jgi:tetratricopeptide (TPR) repeat protein